MSEQDAEKGAYIDWDDGDTLQDVLHSFDDYAPRTTDMVRDYGENIDLIVAVYLYESYSGDAMVVYRDKRDGKTYEVNGSHCSCYGLEGQWVPELIEKQELLNRPRYFSEWFSGARDINDKIRDTLRVALK